MDVQAAQDLAEATLSPLGDRWRHTQGVAARAGLAATVVDPGARDLLLAAAWLHDIGYAPDVAETGLHALDGARYLAAEGWPPLLCQLVAHHTAASVEAEQRGMAAELAVFPAPDPVLLDALTFADMTASPQGLTVTVEQRLAEILGRYPGSHPVHSAVLLGAADLQGAVERTSWRLGLASQPM
jgi:hypothetical protein